MPEPHIHPRRSLRLKGFDYTSTGLYFLTICSKNRACLFGEIIDSKISLIHAGELVRVIWNELPKHFPDIDTDAFVIMPNHLHGIGGISDTPVGAIHELPLQQNNPTLRRKMLLPKVVGYLKMNSAKRINQSRNFPGFPVWQRNYYDRIIRNDEELNRIRQYIMDNPLNWEIDAENPKATIPNVEDLW